MHITSKIAGGAGIAWVVVNVGAGMSTGEPPAIDANSAEIADYFTANRGMFLTVMAAFAVTLPLLLVFFGDLVGRLRSTASESSPSVSVAAQSGLTLFAGGISLAYVLMLPFVLDTSLADTASDDLLRTFYIAMFMVTMIGNIGAAVLLLALATSESVLGRWGRASGAVIGGVVLLASAAGLANADVAVAAGASFAVIGLWMLGVGIGMVRQPQLASLSVAMPVAA